MNVVTYTQEICVFYQEAAEKNTIFNFFNQIRLYHRFHLHIRGLMMNKVCRISVPNICVWKLRESVYGIA